MAFSSVSIVAVAIALSLPNGSSSQAVVTPGVVQQMSSTNPATTPDGCDIGALNTHLNSIANSLPDTLSSAGGGLDSLSNALKGRSQSNPADSCSQIRQLQPTGSPSGNYWLRNQEDNTGVSVYCDMDISCGCGSQQGWTRLALFDMSDASTNCPSQWRLLQGGGNRACGRTTNGFGWNARAHSVQGVPYQKVCGKVIGYVFGSPDAFDRWNSQKWRAENEVYFDGVDIVYGHNNPNNYNHLWTNAATFADNQIKCPCRTGSNRIVPTFIGTNHYCEGGNPGGGWSASLKTNDPLWDGMQCTGLEAPCCTTGAPWFCRNVTTSTGFTSEDLVIRLMADSGWNDEDSTVHYYELYVQ